MNWFGLAIVFGYATVISLAISLFLWGARVDNSIKTNTGPVIMSVLTMSLFVMTLVSTALCK